MSQPRKTSGAAPDPGGRWTAAALARVGLTFVFIFVVEAAVCGVSATPAALCLVMLTNLVTDPWLRAVLLAMAAVPAYALFALCLMAVSAATTRLTGARTPPNAEMRIADMGWPLLQWARYMAASHVVRVFAGGLFRGTPIWTLYLRMNGARLGRRVYVNSLSVSDHNLLDFGNDVVIGADVHLSGHTVERGIVKTGGVTLGDGVTIGLCSVIDIDVHVGQRAQVGALSFVPKHARLDGGQAYVGVPVKVLHRGDAPSEGGAYPYVCTFPEH
jgi:acetyltransferase-like isoleucine patch superfamily enzyme